MTYEHDNMYYDSPSVNWLLAFNTFATTLAVPCYSPTIQLTNDPFVSVS